ncbi:hypothetical protein HUG20_15450 [Salicibibacter cibi]|uniref:Uncharacterized protein n=1 Tax=Salicibibacter cibi TaxID=2743001 RepID=A0A7T6ZD17_9BACI|nr:hypothetical protein [Salicibibacter cibi]QQK81156.1 hypothetical protein HUG20_15450 [Salicibibacter cibi]
MNAAVDANEDVIISGRRFQEPDGINGLLSSIPCHNAGLVYTDLMNEDYAPAKKDDSHEERYVTINGQNYPSLKDTPAGFTRKGIVVDFPSFDNMDLSKHDGEGLLGDVIPAELKTPIIIRKLSMVSELARMGCTGVNIRMRTLLATEFMRITERLWLTSSGTLLPTTQTSMKGKIMR